MKVEIPKDVEAILLQILSKSQEANLVLSGFISGKELKPPIQLSGKFELEVEDPIKEDVRTTD